MKLSRHLLCISLLLALLLTLALPAAAVDPGGQKIGVAYVIASSLRLRAGPSTSSNTLAYASQNEVVVLLGKTGSWYKVLYNLTEGYMHQDYLAVSTVKNVELGYGNVNYSQVNMRTGPSTSYRAIGQSSKGDPAYTTAC